jgi:hypothetical protein
MSKEEALERAQNLIDFYGSGTYKGYEEITMPDGRPGVSVMGFVPSITNMANEWIIVHEPVPADEQPSQYLARMTGHDFSVLDGVTWNDVRENESVMHYFEWVLQRLSRPQVIAVRKPE